VRLVRCALCAEPQSKSWGEDSLSSTTFSWPEKGESRDYQECPNLPDPVDVGGILIAGKGSDSGTASFGRNTDDGKFCAENARTP